MAYFGSERAVRRMPLMVGVLAISLLAGCGGKLNPFNWFGHRAKTVAEVSIAVPSDPRPLIATITALRLEDVPTGALLTATGRGEAVGSWNADLVALPVQDGVLTLEFRAWPGTNAGSPRTREVTAGLHLSRKDLAGVSRIVVQGAQNTQSVKP
jgi:hypothetical protein